MKGHPHSDPLPVSCAAESPAMRGMTGMFMCTRSEGHPGSHIANGVDAVVAIWDDELFWARVMEHAPAPTGGCSGGWSWV